MINTISFDNLNSFNGQKKQSMDLGTGDAEAFASIFNVTILASSNINSQTVALSGGQGQALTGIRPTDSADDLAESDQSQPETSSATFAFQPIPPAQPMIAGDPAAKSEVNATTDTAVSLLASKPESSSFSVSLTAKSFVFQKGPEPVITGNYAKLPVNVPAAAANGEDPTGRIWSGPPQQDGARIPPPSQKDFSLAIMNQIRRINGDVPTRNIAAPPTGDTGQTPPDLLKKTSKSSVVQNGPEPVVTGNFAKLPVNVPVAAAKGEDPAGGIWSGPPQQDGARIPPPSQKDFSLAIMNQIRRITGDVPTRNIAAPPTGDTGKTQIPIAFNQSAAGSVIVGTSSDSSKKEITFQSNISPVNEPANDSPSFQAPKIEGSPNSKTVTFLGVANSNGTNTTDLVTPTVSGAAIDQPAPDTLKLATPSEPNQASVKISLFDVVKTESDAAAAPKTVKKAAPFSAEIDSNSFSAPLGREPRDQTGTATATAMATAKEPSAAADGSTNNAGSNPTQINAMFETSQTGRGVQDQVMTVPMTPPASPNPDSDISASAKYSEAVSPQMSEPVKAASVAEANAGRMAINDEAAIVRTPEPTGRPGVWQNPTIIEEDDAANNPNSAGTDIANEAVKIADAVVTKPAVRTDPIPTDTDGVRQSLSVPLDADPEPTPASKSDSDVPADVRKQAMGIDPSFPRVEVGAGTKTIGSETVADLQKAGIRTAAYVPPPVPTDVKVKSPVFQDGRSIVDTSDSTNSKDAPAQKLAFESMQQQKIVAADDMKGSLATKLATTVNDAKTSVDNTAKSSKAFQAQQISPITAEPRKDAAKIQSDASDQHSGAAAGAAAKSAVTTASNSSGGSNRGMSQSERESRGEPKEMKVAEISTGPKFDGFFDPAVKTKGPDSVEKQIADLAVKLNDQLEPRVLQLAAITSVGNDKKMLKMRLNPAELGSVEITLEKSASGRISAIFHTETEASQRILNQGLTQLRNSLENAGCPVGNIQITLNSSNSNNGGQNGDRSQQFGQAEDNSVPNTNPDGSSTTEDDQQERLVNLRA